jgi:hypothetical protein
VVGINYHQFQLWLAWACLISQDHHKYHSRSDCPPITFLRYSDHSPLRRQTRRQLLQGCYIFWNLTWFRMHTYPILS